MDNCSWCKNPIVTPVGKYNEFCSKKCEEEEDADAFLAGSCYMADYDEPEGEHTQ